MLKKKSEKMRKVWRKMEELTEKNSGWSRRLRQSRRRERDLALKEGLRRLRAVFVPPKLADVIYRLYVFSQRLLYIHTSS